MKKDEKISIIRTAIEHVDICRCYFQYDPDYFYYYPNAVNDKFILGQEEDDFLLDGYAIRKISHLKKVEISLTEAVPAFPSLKSSRIAFNITSLLSILSYVPPVCYLSLVINTLAILLNYYITKL